MEPPQLKLELLEKITDDFSVEHKLGEGTFGEVYRGVYENGEEIAVKLLRNNGPGLDDKQFKDELSNLIRLKHPNIVQIVGYCYETQHKYIEINGIPVFAEKTYRALCFEYLRNGSLQKHLSDEFHGLDWHTRYKIIKGTCGGLKYIHVELEDPIYHLDLKPDNILLDEDMAPKLADFGLSRIFTSEPTRITQSVVGTIGYWPPEYIERSVISKEFDVFSLGVVIIKILTGAEGYSKCADMPSEEFINLVQKNWRNMLQTTWSGSSLEAYCQQVEICTRIALECVERDRHKRPNIVNIVNKLNEIENEISKTMLLNVQPLQLQFSMEPNNSMMSCSLHLTNSTDHQVAFLLQTKNPEEYLEPLCGIVHPRSSYTLTVTRCYQVPQPPANSDGYFTLQSIIADNQEIQYEIFDAADRFCRFFMEAKQHGCEVYQMNLAAVYAPTVPGNTKSEHGFWSWSCAKQSLRFTEFRRLWSIYYFHVLRK